MARFSAVMHGLTIFQMGLLMGIITTGGCLLLTSSDEMHCPDAEDIAPCVCSYDVESQALDMNCSNVKSEEELREVFRQNFPFTNFRDFSIYKNKNIATLKQGDFGNVSFTRIYFFKTMLTEIEDLALEGSRDTLTVLSLVANEVNRVPDITKFPRLSNLILPSNKLAQVPILNSTTLTYLCIADNNFTQIPSDIIRGLPLLQVLHLVKNPLTEIDSGTFANAEHLNYLSFENCSLTAIPKDTIRLHGNDSQLLLSFNQLTSIPLDVVSGVTGSLSVDFDKLTELPEKTYRPLLERNVTVDVEGNPFNCGCDIAWLIEDKTLLYKLPSVDDIKCADGQRFLDLDPEYYKENCP